MAQLGRQKWSSESGAWVDDLGEELEFSESVDTSPDQKQPSLTARPSTRGFDSNTMRRLPQVAMVLLGAGILASVIFMVLMLNKPTSSAPSFQDLGPGVSNLAGLEGFLVTRWQKGVQYQLKFEPLFAMYAPGFSFTVGHPPEPLWINLRLLDSTGYQLCGKQVEFHVVPARSNIDFTLLRQPEVRKLTVSIASPRTPATGAQAAVQAGRTPDTFQNELGDNGQVAFVYAQGILPCSEAQYEKFNYWDFSTNFPSLDKQNTLMKAPAIAAARALAAAREAQKRKEARSPHYFVEGDTAVRGYDQATATLQAGTGQSFVVVKRAELATANSWAESNAQIHYKCDTYSNCMLTRAGDGRIVDTRSIP